MVEIKGKFGIVARIIADSISQYGKRMVTYEIEYPRFIHSEIMTHRALSKNSASSRAIPIDSALDQILKSPAIPVQWGKNQPGMQAAEELEGVELFHAQHQWVEGRLGAIETARKLQSAGLHKQIVSRVTEPWMIMKTVISGTEWANFFWLRNHSAAQPEFAHLAEVMHRALQRSIPKNLRPWQWHMPYVETAYEDQEDEQTFIDHTGKHISIETALKVSSSCCAQVSYRKLNDDIDKAISIYDKLVSADRVHSSPFEHQSMAGQKTWGFIDHPGITHIDRSSNWWSGNLQGFIQHRQLISNNTKWDL